MSQDILDIMCNTNQALRSNFSIDDWNAEIGFALSHSHIFNILIDFNDSHSHLTESQKTKLIPKVHENNSISWSDYIITAQNNMQ